MRQRGIRWCRRVADVAIVAGFTVGDFEEGAPAALLEVCAAEIEGKAELAALARRSILSNSFS